MPIPPETDRLAFREWTTADLDEFHAICCDPQAMQFVADGAPWGRERTGQFLDRNFAAAADLGFCLWTLIDTTDDRLIGYCGFIDSDSAPEIGWRLAPEYWGRGLATEGARQVVRFGFDSLGFDRIIATVQSANLASLRVVEKLGMRRIETYERHGREVLLFELTKSDSVA
ncbi:MAG: N-acetyltransferase [Planctomycetota bacterium]|nr:MAG: N-acetyltransferase [Planctomycetota bacterium]REK22815.1 MAG: N-acetyltransferase [Planctomycetota bacterium]REK31580.1 MAG: N-acetyltransferase [Planctomycetota bacterium]